MNEKGLLSVEAFWAFRTEAVHVVHAEFSLNVHPRAFTPKITIPIIIVWAPLHHMLKIAICLSAHLLIFQIITEWDLIRI